MAAVFIADKFKELALLPKGDNGDYFQYFTVNDGKAIAPSTRLSINGLKLDSEIDFFPLANSLQGSSKGESSKEVLERIGSHQAQIVVTIDPEAAVPTDDVVQKVRQNFKLGQLLEQKSLIVLL